MDGLKSKMEEESDGSHCNVVVGLNKQSSTNSEENHAERTWANNNDEERNMSSIQQINDNERDETDINGVIVTIDNCETNDTYIDETSDKGEGMEIDNSRESSEEKSTESVKEEQATSVLVASPGDEGHQPVQKKINGSDRKS